MELESSYQLLGMLLDDGIRTFNAVEIASGQPLQVHLFAKVDSEPDRTLFKTIRALPVSKRRELLEIGMEGDKPYIVTEKLPDGITPRDWLTKLAGMAPSRPVGPVMLAGTWKTGTPIPEELVRASHTSTPPKPPPAPPKPAELTPDYTRVMRLPQALGAMQPPAVPVTPAAPPVSVSPVPQAAAPVVTPPIAATPPVLPPAAPPVQPAEPDEFERMFQTAPVVPAVETQPEPEPESLIIAAEPARKEPGEFTRMFLASQPAEPPPAPPVAQEPVLPPPEPPQPPPLQPAAKEPGEFTRMFLASQPPAEPAPPPQQPGEFTRQFLASQPAEPPAAPPAAAQASVVPAEPVPQPQAPPQPPSEEPTRLFQAVTPSTPLPAPPAAAAPVKEPGEFTRMFPTVKPDPPSTPVFPPPAQPKSDGPSEFTRFFQSPMYPTPAGNQRPATTPMSTPVANRPSAQAGEFTQMFGNPTRPNPTGPNPVAPPLVGSGGSATGAFSIPQAATFPPSKSSEPGEFTRMMSASAAPTLGQPPAKPAAPPTVQPKAAKSAMPLYIVGGALLLAIVLVIVFFLLRH
jgi:hypothetical protein